jgi:hypothetical protein
MCCSYRITINSCIRHTVHICIVLCCAVLLYVPTVACSTFSNSAASVECKYIPILIQKSGIGPERQGVEQVRMLHQSVAQVYTK